MEIIDAGRVRICVSATRISGRDYVDIRVFTTDSVGMLRPTSNGLPIPVECLEQVVKASRKESEHALQQAPATLYYFREHVEDKTEVYSALTNRVFTTAKDAVRKTPKQQGADAQHGYIFKATEYVITKTSYVFQPSTPFAVWSELQNKWVRWEKRNEHHRKK